MEILLTEQRKLDPKEFIVPPDWAVRLVSTNFGKKGRKYPSSWVGQSWGHVYPGQSDSDYMAPWGMGPQDHSGAYEEHWRKARRQAEERDAKMVVRGNLREEQYRFWNGSSVVSTDIATCRWCRHWAYGQAAMTLHQHNTDHTRILREIYDTARKMSLRRCFACGSTTRKERWGIPLCASNRCLNKWRVGPIVELGTTLLFYARYCRAKGLLKAWLNEDGSEKVNFENTPKPFNWERPNVY
jgi:hypothetical protein